MFSANSSQVSDAKLYVEDVFSTWLYTGGVFDPLTITNGIDLSGKGGLVWIKNRGNANSHILCDTARGVSRALVTNTTAAEAVSAGAYVTSFNSNGFALGGNSIAYNGAYNYASWTFRKAPKFFDVVTYTGNGTARDIAHSLGTTPGCIIIKSTSSANSWFVQHRGMGVNDYILLDSTSAKDTSLSLWDTSLNTGTTFRVGTNGNINGSGVTYVAYLFAHDATSDGIIQCGSFTTDASRNYSINLGWEPQWILTKPTSTTGNWQIYDTMRQWDANQNALQLVPNTSAAEFGPVNTGAPTATGVLKTGGGTAEIASQTYIYIAIRRGPMRTPTSGTSVFSPVIWTGNATSPRTITGGGFPVDLSITYNRGTAGWDHLFVDRLRGAPKNTSTSYLLQANSTVQEITNQYGAVGALDIQDGVGLYTGSSTFDNTNASGNTYLGHFFRRAPSFFDEVCYTGTGSGGGLIGHNLGVIPQLVIYKPRSASGDWRVYLSEAVAPYPSRDFGYLNLSNAFDPSWSGQLYTATATQFPRANYPAGTTVATYLFASCPGVSKIGSYTGNGSSQTINCGFAAGARFVMIKRTDSTGSWWVWDVARGLVSGNDPALQLNSTAAETTGIDSIDPDSSGFIVNQDTTTNINVSSGTYVYLAIS